LRKSFNPYRPSAVGQVGFWVPQKHNLQHKKQFDIDKYEQNKNGLVWLNLVNIVSFLNMVINNSETINNLTTNKQTIFIHEQIKLRRTNEAIDRCNRYCCYVF